jgi:hypothetical protein
MVLSGLPMNTPSLAEAVREAVRITEKQHKTMDDVEVMALYSFAGNGTAFVVWLDRDPTGAWMLSTKRSERDTGD